MTIKGAYQAILAVLDGESLMQPGSPDKILRNTHHVGCRRGAASERGAARELVFRSMDALGAIEIAWHGLPDVNQTDLLN